MQPTSSQILAAAKRAALDEAERVAGHEVSPFLIGVAVEAAARVLGSVHPGFREISPRVDGDAAA